MEHLIKKPKTGNYRQNLRDSESRYKSLFENSVTGFAQISIDGRLIEANAALATLYGYSGPEEMINKVNNVSQLYENPSERTEILRVLIEKGEIKPCEISMVRSDGTRLAVLVGEREVRDTNGRVVCYQAEHVDITDRKRKEEEFSNITQRKEAEVKIMESESSYRTLLPIWEQDCSSMVLRDLNRHIEKAREEERTKISQNLHDDLGQKLTALKMDFSWLKARVGVQSTIVSEKFASMENSLDEAVGTVQRISSDLRPGILYDLGLTAAIEWQMNEFSRTTGIKSTLRVNLKDISINDNLSIIVFRIIQESLTNIIRHSQATEVSVNLKYQKGYLHMIIRDNGIGIDQDKLNNQKSFGLMGMKERARAFGGEVKIKGVKGTGSTVNVIIPMAVE